MNKKYVAKLAAYTAMLATLYIPQQALATTFNEGVITSPLYQLAAEDTSVTATAVNGTTFTDTFNFTVNHAARLSGNESSSFKYVATTVGGGVNNFATGIELTSVKLIETGPQGNTFTYNFTQALTTPVKSGPFDSVTDTFTLPSSVYLSTADTYKLVVTGIIGSTTAASGHAGYSDALTVASVPEPEQWGMLLLGLPLIGWVARQKQVGSATAITA
jgi:hypothetical protein